MIVWLSLRRDELITRPLCREMGLGIFLPVQDVCGSVSAWKYAQTSVSRKHVQRLVYIYILCLSLDHTTSCWLFLAVILADVQITSSTLPTKTTPTTQASSQHHVHISSRYHSLSASDLIQLNIESVLVSAVDEPALQFSSKRECPTPHASFVPAQKVLYVPSLQSDGLASCRHWSQCC